MAADKPPTFLFTAHSSPLPKQQRGFGEEGATLLPFPPSPGTTVLLARCGTVKDGRDPQ